MGWPLPLFVDEAGIAVDGHETLPALHVRCLLRPDAFDRVANPGFETDASGWSVAAGVNGAGTSITRVTTDARSGSACGQLVTAATAGSGCNHDLGADRYWQESAHGTAYVGLVWLRRVSGPRRARLVLGSEGTSSDRATLVIEDLSDDWAPYRVTWMPAANRTDAQLAVVTDVAASLTVLIDDASVTQADAMSQVENSSFGVDTTGWAVTAGINAAGTSITRSASGGMCAVPGGTAGCATLVTTATDGSGANYDLGARHFATDRTYRARVGLRHASSASVRLRLGSLGTPADRGDRTVTATDEWQWHWVDWTPSADRTDAELAITNASASALTVDVSAVEAYEAIDELTGDAGRADVSALSWARPLEAVGTLSATLHDPVGTHRYTPWAASGPLAGLLDTGRRVWARAVWQGAIHGLWFGTATRWVPDAHDGTCALMAEDPMADLAAARATVGFSDSRSYRDARAAMFGAGAIAAGREPAAGDARTDLSTGHQEQATLYDGTNGEVSVLDYLQALCEATGTAHLIAPDSRAEVLWRYATVDRADLTDAGGSAVTLSGDGIADVSGMELSDETVETAQSVTWQAYERLAPAGTLLAQARDPASYADVDGDDPYLHWVRDDVSTDEDVPEPTYEREWSWRRRRARRGRKRIRVRTYHHRRVYPDAFVPMTLDATTTRAWDVTLAAAVVIDGVATAHPSATPATVSWRQRSPREASFLAYAAGASTTGSVRVTGAAWLPLGEATVTREAAAAMLLRGRRQGPVTNTPYVGSAGAAEGLAEHREWRHGEPRLRPTARHEHGLWGDMLPLGPTSLVTLDAERFALSSAPMTVTGVAGDVTQGGRAWALTLSLEALPASPGTLLRLDEHALDGSAVLA